MKLYKVTLLADEREELEAITHKGSHQSQKVINALILLNCDEGEFNDHRARGEDVANILRIMERENGRWARGAVHKRCRVLRGHDSSAGTIRRSAGFGG